MTELLSIAKKLEKINRKCYVVGSFCVHKILEKEFDGDIDLTTDATSDEIRHVLKVVGEIGQKYGTLIISEGSKKFEITTFRKDIGSINKRRPETVEFTRSLEEDAARRDFTFNAIYYDILEDRFIDPTGGIPDLNNKIIRFIGNPEDRLDEDMLRLLRYVRFRFAYGFLPAHKNYDTIFKRRIIELADISIERIRQEFDKILIHPSNTKALEYLSKSRFLEIFLPEVQALLSTEGGPKHHLEGTVWKHTLLSIRALSVIFETPKIIQETKIHELKIILFWTLLLHDIGKAPTFSKDENGNVHYFDHENIGSTMIREIAKRWKMSVLEREKITWLIKHHLYPQKLSEMRRLKVNKLMMHSLFLPLLVVCMADGKGKKPVYRLPYKKIMQRYSRFHDLLKNTKLLTGNDIMYRYPDLTGAEIGRKMEELNNQILAKI